MAVRQYQAYAAPSIWGPWVTVAEHIGVVSYTITGEAVGDTILRCNIRYFKTDVNQVVEEWSDEVTITTGNSVSKVEVRFMGLPLGSAVNGTINP